MKYQYLNTDEMQALESHAFTNYPITLEQMMQKAGKAVFDVVMSILKQVQDDEQRILVVVGKGNNGGDALVTARLLHEKGTPVTVLSPYPDEEFSDMAKCELDKIRKLVPGLIRDVGNFDNSFSLIIDALFGFSLKGDPRQTAAKIIEQINCTTPHIPVLSVDIPSGLDVHNGSIGNPIIKADYTVAFGMLKKGFEEHPEYIGKVYLGDLGIPESAYRDMSYEPPMFREKSYISVN